MTAEINEPRKLGLRMTAGGEMPGAPGERRLKEVLIDRRVPRGERDRLPLLCLGADGPRVAWVPGVTIDERYRLRRADPTVAGGAWVAAVEPLESGAGRRRWGG